MEINSAPVIIFQVKAYFIQCSYFQFCSIILLVQKQLGLKDLFVLYVKNFGSIVLPTIDPSKQSRFSLDEFCLLQFYLSVFHHCN